jgi:hypothetical protein
MLKNIVVSWYGEITLNPKRKTHKVHKNKSPFKYPNYVPMGHKNKTKIIQFKRTFENKVQF